MQAKHKGAHSELIASAWLLRQGYEVFRNVSQHGRVDIIAIRNNEIIYIDVKTDAPSRTGYFRRTVPPPGLTYILVSPNGDCRWWPEPQGNVTSLAISADA